MPFTTMPSSSYHHPYLEDSSHHQLFNSRSRVLGYSKAQICFFKILHTISSVPPSAQQQHSSPTGPIAIDLNLRFCSVSEDAEFQDSAQNGIDSSAIEAIGGAEKSVETKIEEEIGERGVENEYNCLDLLIDAAKVISGKEESKIEERRRSNEAKERWMVVNLFSDDDLDEEKSSPAVVRTTKRGRSKALPYRFRDSAMEPLKRRSRPPHSPSSSRKRLVGSYNVKR